MHSVTREICPLCVQVGGVPAVLKYLLSKGLLHGDCLTVTGTVMLMQQLCTAGV